MSETGGHRCQHPERDALILLLVGLGHTYVEISREVRLSPARICVIVAAHGGKPIQKSVRLARKSRTDVPSQEPV